MFLQADTQRMYEQVVKTKTQLEKQNSSLMVKVNRLQEELSLTRIWLKDVMGVREKMYHDQNELWATPENKEFDFQGSAVFVNQYSK